MKSPHSPIFRPTPTEAPSPSPFPHSGLRPANVVSPPPQAFYLVPPPGPLPRNTPIVLSLDPPTGPLPCPTFWSSPGAPRPGPFPRLTYYSSSSPCCWHLSSSHSGTSLAQSRPPSFTLNQRPNQKKNMVYGTLVGPYAVADYNLTDDSNTCTMDNPMPETVDFIPQSGTLDLASGIMLCYVYCWRHRAGNEINYKCYQLKLHWPSLLLIFATYSIFYNAFFVTYNFISSSVHMYYSLSPPSSCKQRWWGRRSFQR
jgi:hypothetical protein